MSRGGAGQHVCGSRATGRRTRWWLVAPITLLLMVFGAVTAGPASAHALLLSTTPGIGSELADAPSSVSLTFDGPVTGSDRAIVVTADGQRLDTGAPVTHGATISVGLRPGPARASYSVVWRVGSSDGHPVDGSFSFGVGEPAGPAPSTSSVAGDGLVAALDDAALALAYVGLVLVIGVPLTLGTLWPAASSLPRVRAMVAAGWGVEVAATIGLLLLTGPVTAGTGITTVAHGLGSTLATRSARLLLARLVLLALVLPALRRLLVREGGSTLDLAVLAVLLAVSFPLGDHADTGSRPWLWVALGSVHVLAAAVWLGGLTVLGVALLRQASPPPLAAWSRVAAGCVLALVVTGTLAGVREVSGLEPLLRTGYGVTLLVKIGVFVVLLAGAEASRRALGRGSVTTLRRSVGAEAVLGAVVIAVTASLVATQPARDAYPSPLAMRLPLLDLDGSPTGGVAQVRVDRTRVGPETVTLTLPAGTAPTTVIGTLADVLHEDDPLRFPFVFGTPGVGTAQVDVPEAGSWTFAVQLRGGSGAASDRSGQLTYTVR